MTRGENDPAPSGEHLPPGQHRVAEPPVMHYGRVPERDPSSWTVTIGGATASGAERVLTLADVVALPSVTEVADMHCATSWTAVGIEWHGVRARDVVAMAPPAGDAVGALVFAEFGYAANIRITDLDDALLVTHRDGVPLSAERGGPLRLVIPHLYTWKGPKWLRGWNYLRAEDPDRGFWEQRGYHSHGEAWAEQRWEVRPPSAR